MIGYFGLKVLVIFEYCSEVWGYMSGSRNIPYMITSWCTQNAQFNDPLGFRLKGLLHGTLVSAHAWNWMKFCTMTVEVFIR